MTGRQFKYEESRLEDLLEPLIIDAVRAKQEMPDDELMRRRIIDDALLCADIGMRKSDRPHTGRPLYYAAALVASLAAVLFFAWIVIAPKSLPDIRPDSRPTASPETSAAEVTEDWAERPKIATPSYIHMDFAPGIQAAVTPDTQYTVDRTRLNRIAVKIARGAVWVSKKPDTRQTRLEIGTPRGTVMVTGTVFSVYVDEQSLKVAVFKGAVHVIEAVGSDLTVLEGHIVTVDEKGARQEKDPEPEKTRAEFVRLGILEEKNTRALAEDPRAPKKTTPSDGAGRSLLEPIEPRVSPEDLLSQIGLLRRQKDWAGMSMTYRRLIREHRRSSQAGPAMVALGNLLVEKLDDPEDAVHWFDVYIESNGGSLAPEALFGKAKALRRLGDRSGESAVLNEIVKRYPKSLYARQAADWLADRERK